jgi:hypothetical protein
MPLDTNLNVSPYFDDYNPAKDYYRILFKPGVAVQVRELNQIQDMFQNQIEEFGDNIFKRGTIVQGCNFSFYPNYPYAKLLDVDLNNEPLNVSTMQGKYVQSVNTGVIAYVLSTASGFVSTDPNLNTLYLRYQSAGTSNLEITTFNPAEVLTIYDANNSVANASIVAGGSGFQNTDSLVFLSSLSVQNTTGGVLFVNTSASACSFTSGQQITGSTSNARAVIVSVNTTANVSSVILNIKPLSTDLSTGNASVWTFLTGEPISVTNGVQGAALQSLIGTGAAGLLVTDSSGAIIDVDITAQGEGYYVAPSLTVSSQTGAINTLNLVAENFYQQVTVASTANAIGSAYAFGVSEGVIYQKGYFARVDSQTTVIDKYANTPDQICVGFDTSENIVNAAVDSSLYDNAAGAPNYTAPGADRLQLLPTLLVQSSANAATDPDFFSICSWSNGNPYAQAQLTAYNQLEVELAQRTYESSGNFVVDPFHVTTTSPSTYADESTEFNAVIDAGTAYVSGYRVASEFNYVQEISKGIDTNTINTSISLDMGSYVRVQQLGGVFLFTTGDYVTLYDTAATYLTSSYGTTPAPVGNEIGTARIRSLVYEGGGDPGTPTAIYRLYLFEIITIPGKQFQNTQSIYYNNSGLNIAGVADVILTANVIANQNTCVLQEPSSSHLIFEVGTPAIKSISNVTYQYRTLNSANVNTSGMIAIALTGNNETFPYLGGTTLSPAEDGDIIVIPTANVQTANVTGTVTVNTTSSVVTGSGTSLNTTFTAGDYIYLTDGTHTSVHRVTSVANGTSLTLDANCSFSNTASASLYFPQFVPVPIATRAARSINVNGGSTLLTINLAANVVANATLDVAYNVQVSNAQPTMKIPQRDIFVQINTANDSYFPGANTQWGGTLGPWYLGIPDPIRLKGVFLGSSNTAQNITTNFYLDRNENSDEIQGAMLYLSPQSDLVLANNQTLTIQMDAFTVGTTNGYGVSCISYVANAQASDVYDLADLKTQGFINTLEIPETVDQFGNYYDLRDCIDFRVIEVNAATYATSSNLATINPVRPYGNVKFGNTANTQNNKKFPNPYSALTCSVEYYMGRTDLVTINSNGSFNIIKGTPGTNTTPIAPSNSLTINPITVPAYPTLPLVLAVNTAVIAAKSIQSSVGPYERQSNFSIAIPTTITGVTQSQPEVYTMADIGLLEQRITNLEYVVSLNSLQAQLASQVIPSTVNGADRFKFGFFSDDFTSTNYSAISDPAYNATILNNQLVPKKSQINLSYEFGPNTFANGKNSTIPYNEYTVLQQLVATNGPVVVPTPAPTPSPTPSPAPTPAPAPSPPPPVQQPHYNGVYTEIVPSSFQPIGKTGLIAVSAGFNANSLNTVLYSSETSASGGTLSYYPGQGSLIRDANGYSYTPISYVAVDTVFILRVAGLRPLTIHKFLFNGADQSGLCQPDFPNTVGSSEVGLIGASLVSQPDGTLGFVYYYQSGVTAPASGTSPAAMSAELAFQQALSKLIGNKTIQVISGDGLSQATGTISFVSATPAPSPSGPAPIKGGGGGGGCVVIDAEIYGFEGLAADVKVGDHLILADEKTLEERNGLVSYSETNIQPCVQVETESGAVLTCSTSAPIPTDDGVKKAPQVHGYKVAVRHGDETKWDTVTKVEYVGHRAVQFITCENACFWAADDSSKGYILHHNLMAYK